MSVIIKTMTKLPKYCYDCPCHNGESGYCQADKEHRYCIDRPLWCPLLLEIPPVKAIPVPAVEEMKRKIKEHNEFSRDEIDEMYMQDVLKIIDECCGIIEADKENREWN